LQQDLGDFIAAAQNPKVGGSVKNTFSVSRAAIDDFAGWCTGHVDNV
jgi:hypothetical protein